MAESQLVIQHESTVFLPPVLEGIQLEWERTGTPGKLTFTTLKTEGMNFAEGDRVAFSYDGKTLFVGYVFTKKRDRESKIQVTCYDQLRYLKNKYTYVFENKKASEIVKALCADYNLSMGTVDDTGYVLKAVAEENKSALDIILTVLEDTLMNTGKMFVLYDDGGKITLRNVENMKSNVLIYDQTAENYDYSSSIDNETYNNVVLYYKGDNNQITLYTASNAANIKKWGNLRYFEEVKNKTSAQNKANSLLKLYNKRSRELKIKNAFGSTDIRAGSLIPVNLNLGDILVNNFMLVEKVTHKFDKDHYTMDLTIEGAW